MTDREEPMEDYFADVREAMQGKHFRTIREAQAFLDDFTQRRNFAPRAEFDGLSSEQMSAMLYNPFHSPEIVSFPTDIDPPVSAPILTLFQMLVDAIGEQGLKPTATGNLPRKFVQEAGRAYWGEEKLRYLVHYGNIRSETDFYDMHVTRVVAELASLVRKYKGKFILGRDCKKLLRQHGLAGVYPRLLRAYAEEFSWSYWDGYPEIDLIESSFLFTLYLLHRQGDEWRSNEFYEDAFLRAFPVVLRQVPELSYSTPEETVRHCYSARCLRHFAGFLGLAEIEKESDSFFERRFKLRKSPLLDRAVVFRV